jgi:putative Holliday junction resolvase
VRILGIDLGSRRIGLAISDVSLTLARPLATLTVRREAADNERDVAHRVVELALGEIVRLSAEEDGLSRIVVGMPARLDGSATEQTVRATAFVAALRERTSIPVVTEDERLTSVEAESRLAHRERNWRKRKAQLDAAAAAVILQDYLDRNRPS